MQKMRILSFVSMAIDQKEIPFSTIENELKIETEQVEGFIIEGEYCMLYIISGRISSFLNQFFFNGFFFNSLLL